MRKALEVKSLVVSEIVEKLNNSSSAVVACSELCSFNGSYNKS